MKIKFNKKITGYDSLKGSFKEEDKIFGYDNSDRYFILLNFNENTFINETISELEKKFSENKYNFTKTSEKDLWFYSPELFRLSIDSVEIDAYFNREYEKIGEVERKALFSKRNVPLVRQIPKVEIDGEVVFEKIRDNNNFLKKIRDNNNFLKVLNILGELNYSSKVITTSEEKEKNNKKNINIHNTTNVSSSNKEYYDYY